MKLEMKPEMASDAVLWHQLPEAEACRRLGSDPDKGLQPAEAARRLLEYAFFGALAGCVLWAEEIRKWVVRRQ